MNYRFFTLCLIVVAQFGLISSAYANELNQRLEVLQETIEIEVPSQVEGEEAKKVTLIMTKAQPKSLEEMVLAKEWLSEQEKKTPFNLKLAISKTGHNATQKLKGLFKKGAEVLDVVLPTEVAENVRKNLKDDIDALKKLPKKTGDTLANLAETGSKKQIVKLGPAWGKTITASRYDLSLGTVRMIVNGVGYTIALSTTLPFMEASTIGIVMGFLSGSVQMFSNHFGDWLERRGYQYKYIVEPIFKPFMAAAGAIKSEEAKEKADKILNMFKEKVNYYSKYMVFEAGFVGAFYGLLTAVGHQPQEAILLYLAAKVPLATMSQGVLEEYFLKIRAEDKKKLPEIKAKLRYSTKLMVVSVLTNSAIALASLSPDVAWIGENTLYALGLTGVGLYANYYRTELKNKATGAVKKLVDLVARPISAVKHSQAATNISYSCNDFLSKAFPAQNIVNDVRFQQQVQSSL